MVARMGEDPWKAQMGALGAVIRAQRTVAELSLRDLAALADVSNAYLSQIERGLHEPSLKVLKSIADALQVPLEAMLGRAGLIDGPGATVDTAAAIRDDPRLTEPQRMALLSVYRSFVPRS